jgi:hypothetical protein
MLVRTLDAMALGGIHDHLAGGFHRYSTEPTWSIPHFEKMLYDNAQLVGVYARAFALTGRPLYRRVVERTLAYLDREMSLPEGGFASAQDAEVDGEEGASYVWSRAEIERVLGPKRAAAFLAVYELAPMPDDPERGVLRVRLSSARPRGSSETPDVAELLRPFEADRAALLAQRNEGPQPLRDDKALAAWNGLAIRGLVEAAQALGRPQVLRRAERAAEFVLARLLTEEGALRRSYIAGQAREAGVLDDYAFLSDGLLALSQATGNARWRAASERLAGAMLARFEDERGGGFFLTPAGTRLLVRPKPFDDNEVPSGNAVALRVLRALAGGADSGRWAEAAARTASAAAPLLRRAPYALPSTVAALAGAPAIRTALHAGPPGAVPAQPAPSERRRARRLPRSEDHVHAALRRSGADPRELVVRIEIDPGWHVNANPASLPFLIPTRVEPLGNGAALDAEYPPGGELRPEFVKEVLRVYEGTVEIPITLRGSKAPPRVALRFQACDEKVCLPPSRVELALSEDGPGAQP